MAHPVFPHREDIVPGQKHDGVFVSAQALPLTLDRRLDEASLVRLIERHIELGLDGISVCGTCMENPWMPKEMWREVAKRSIEIAAGRIPLILQVTSDTGDSMLRRLEIARDLGYKAVAIGKPTQAVPCWDESNAWGMYQELLDMCEGLGLVAGLYDLPGSLEAPEIPISVLPRFLNDPNCGFIMNSHPDQERWITARTIRAKRGDLLLLTGNEFTLCERILPGRAHSADGVLLGGMVVIAKLVRALCTAVWSGKWWLKAVEKQMQIGYILNTMYARNLRYWPTGLKEALKQMGVFETTTTFHPTCQPVTADRKSMIDYVLRVFDLL